MAAGKDLNEYKVMGRVGKVESRTMGNGQVVCSVSIATNEGYYDKRNDKWVDAVEWHKAEGWGRLAEKMEKASKGDHVYAAGSKRSNTGDDKREFTKLKAFDFKIIIEKNPQERGSQQPVPPQQQSQPQSQPAPQNQPAPPPPDSEEDIPF